MPKVGEQKGAGYSFFLGEGSENRQEIALLTDARFEQGRGSITRVFELREGEGADFVLRYGGLKLHDSSNPSTDVKLQGDARLLEEVGKEGQVSREMEGDGRPLGARA